MARSSSAMADTRFEPDHGSLAGDCDMAEESGGLLTVAETARFLQRSTEQVRRYLREGSLPGRRLGGQWFIHAADIEAFLRYRHDRSDDSNEFDAGDPDPLVGAIGIGSSGGADIAVGRAAYFQLLLERAVAMVGEEETASVVFVDASALVALADRDDASHEAAVAAYRDLVRSAFRFFTTDLAFAEAHGLILAALGPNPARSWLAHCNIRVLPVTSADVEKGRRTIEAGQSPARAALTDAIHLAVLDRLGVTDVFAVDRGFLGMLG